jgi:CBF/Mak21 family
MSISLPSSDTSHYVQNGNRHLPATLLASFVKRLARLSLSAPPAAIIMVIPFTYNILKHHPALMTMIHRADVDDPSGGVSLSYFLPLSTLYLCFFIRACGLEPT